MAKIDTTQIEGYESMTPEEKLKALEDYEYEDNLKEVEKYKHLHNKASGEAAEWKRKHNELLSDDEKNKQAREEEVTNLKNQVAELQKEKLLSSHKASFLALGYDDALAEETAAAMVEGDTAKVFANQQKFLTAHDKNIEAELLKRTPRNGEGGSGGDIDYAKKAAEAQLAGDFTSAAYYTRLAQENKE